MVFYVCNFVKERPLLLLYDGHLTHVSAAVIEKALKENVIILKFPPHVTDVLQPLDVSCFGPLKCEWKRKLHRRVSEFGIKNPLTRCEFVNEICAIWNKGMKRESAISGFEKTGIFPVDPEKYPRCRLDPRILRQYELWKETGKSLDWDELAQGNIEISEDLATTVTTTTMPTTTTMTTVMARTSTATTTSLPGASKDVPSTSSPVTNQHISIDELQTVIGPFPFHPPEGFKWIPKWELVPDVAPSTSSASTKMTPIAEKSFEELFLDRVKPARKSKDAPKRQKLDLKAQVVTQVELLEAIKAKDLEKETKAKEAAERKRVREQKRIEKLEKDAEKKRRKEEDQHESEDENSEEYVEEEEEEEREGGEEEKEEEEEEEVENPKRVNTYLTYLPGDQSI